MNLDAKLDLVFGRFFAVAVAAVKGSPLNSEGFCKNFPNDGDSLQKTSKNHSN